MYGNGGKILARALVGTCVVVASVGVGFTAAPSAQASAALAAGDLLAGDYGGNVNHYSADGTFLASIPVGTGLESGACQDNNSGYVYQANDQYSPGGTITQIAPDGTVSDTTWASGLSLPESCAVEPNGDVLVGQQTGPVVVLGSPSSNSPGSVVGTYPGGSNGSSWISLDSDNCTLNVADQSGTINKYNICTNSPAGSLTTSSGVAYQNQPLPNGDLLVAAGTDVEEVNSSGVVRAYTVPGGGALTALAIAADRSSFWVGDHGSGQISRIDMSTGSALQTLAQPGFGAGGLLVYGQGSAVSPGPPQNVTGNATAARGINLRWASPAAGGPVDHYQVVRIVDGQSAGVVGSTTATFFAVTGLRDCSYYRYGVVAIGPDGQASSTAEMAGDAFTEGPPDNSPPVVTILALGVGDQIVGGSFDPLNVNDYCTTLDGVTLQKQPAARAPLADMTSHWINADTAQMTGYGAESNLVDAAASGGGVVLPFSYTGAKLKAGPTFSFSSYSASDVANSSPADKAILMDREIRSIHLVWPKARIVVVGHSNGGLVAEQWWLKYGAANPSGVRQVFALDSPLNGERNTVCTHTITGSACAWLFGVGQTLANYYAKLWKNQATNDPVATALDKSDNLFTAISTYGDPIYDAADYPGKGPRIGEVSQSFYPSSCAGTAYTSSCLPALPAGHWYENPCGPLNDGSPPNYGLLPGGFGDGWMHSVVKNCTIPEIMKYIYP